jgi:hypothetical protein
MTRPVTAPGDRVQRIRRTRLLACLPVAMIHEMAQAAGIYAGQHNRLGWQVRALVMKKWNRELERLIVLWVFEAFEGPPYFSLEPAQGFGL